MKHQQFEEWSFSEEPLLQDEEKSLQAHLSICQDCRIKAEAWQEVKLSLSRAEEAAPKPGFINRWEKLLQERRKQERERQTWLILILCFAGMGVSLALLGSLFFPALAQPYFLLLPVIEKMKSILVWLNVIEEVGQALGGFLPQGAPTLLTVVLVTAFGGLGYSWIVSLQRTAIPKGV